MLEATGWGKEIGKHRL